MLNFLNKNNVMLTYADNVVLGLVGEHVLEHLEGHNVCLAEKLDEEYYSRLLCSEMELLGFNINVAGENVVKNDILDEESLVVFLVVEILDVGERNCQ